MGEPEDVAEEFLRRYAAVLGREEAERFARQAVDHADEEARRSVSHGDQNKGQSSGGHGNPNERERPGREPNAVKQARQILKTTAF